MGSPLQTGATAVPIGCINLWGHWGEQFKGNRLVYFFVAGYLGACLRDASREPIRSLTEPRPVSSCPEEQWIFCRACEVGYDVAVCHCPTPLVKEHSRVVARESSSGSISGSKKYILSYYLACVSLGGQSSIPMLVARFNLLKKKPHQVIVIENDGHVQACGTGLGLVL
jgi:hypothetical protein